MPGNPHRLLSSHFLPKLLPSPLLPVSDLLAPGGKGGGGEGMSSAYCAPGSLLPSPLLTLSSSFLCLLFVFLASLLFKARNTHLLSAGGMPSSSLCFLSSPPSPGPRGPVVSAVLCFLSGWEMRVYGAPTVYQAISFHFLCSYISQFSFLSAPSALSF